MASIVLATTASFPFLFAATVTVTIAVTSAITYALVTYTLPPVTIIESGTSLLTESSRLPVVNRSIVQEDVVVFCTETSATIDDGLATLAKSEAYTVRGEGPHTVLFQPSGTLVTFTIQYFESTMVNDTTLAPILPSDGYIRSNIRLTLLDDPSNVTLTINDQATSFVQNQVMVLSAEQAYTIVLTNSSFGYSRRRSVVVDKRLLYSFSLLI